MHYFKYPFERLSLLGPLASVILWLLGAHHVAAILMLGVGAGALGIFFDELSSYAGRRQRVSAFWHVPWGIVRRGLWVFLVTHLPIFACGLAMVYLAS